MFGDLANLFIVSLFLVVCVGVVPLVAMIQMFYEPTDWRPFLKGGMILMCLSMLLHILLFLSILTLCAIIDYRSSIGF